MNIGENCFLAFELQLASLTVMCRLGIATGVARQEGSTLDAGGSLRVRSAIVLDSVLG